MITKILEVHKLESLNNIETVDMLLSTCKRQLTLDELFMDEDSTKSIHN